MLEDYRSLTPCPLQGGHTLSALWSMYKVGSTGPSKSRSREGRKSTYLVLQSLCLTITRTCYCVWHCTYPTVSQGVYYKSQFALEKTGTHREELANTTKLLSRSLYKKIFSVTIQMLKLPSQCNSPCLSLNDMKVMKNQDSSFYASGWEKIKAKKR